MTSDNKILPLEGLFGINKNNAKAYSVTKVVNLLKSKSVPIEEKESFLLEVCEAERKDDSLEGLSNLCRIVIEDKDGPERQSVTWGPKATVSDAIKHYTEIFTGTGEIMGYIKKIGRLSEQDRLKKDLQTYYLAYKKLVSGIRTEVIETPWSSFGLNLDNARDLKASATRDSKNSFSIKITDSLSGETKMEYNYTYSLEKKNLYGSLYGDWMKDLCDKYFEKTGQRVKSQLHSNELHKCKNSLTFKMIPIFFSMEDYD